MVRLVNYMTEKNENLIKKLKRNEPAAWRELVDLYGDKLFAYALSLCSNHEISYEIVQQVFVNIFERKDKLSTKHSLKSYLYKSTFNKFVDLYRKKKSMTMLHEQYYLMLDQFAVRSEDDFIKNRLEIMNREIDKLPNKTKEVFYLSKKRGFSNIEISELLDVSVKTVEGHITKAFRQLRTEVKKIKT
jgi:RNA polymerase sigma-70 factor (ECF subfamily)